MNVLDITESDSRCEMGLWMHAFVWPEAPWTMNADNNMHFRERAALRAHWREAFRLMARGCTPLETALVSVYHLTATRRSVDPCACMPAYKAALDGIVRAGVLPDDGPAYVRGVYFAAPQYAGRDALIVELSGAEAQPLEDVAL